MTPCILVGRVAGTEGHMSQFFLRAITFAVLALCAASCTTSPLGRRQVNFYSNHEMERIGSLSFEKIKAESPRSNDTAKLAYVNCVTASIVGAMDGERASDWEVVVFENDAANAFALPGRKIGVHTGLLNVARNQDQLATVIGHEVGHVIANHSNERVSQGRLAQAGMVATQIVGQSQGLDAEQQQLLGLLGAGVIQGGFLLPFSRTHEAEADLIGLDLMARAGFDPAQSVDLLENMSQGGSGQPLEFFSTHPSHSTRIRGLNQRIPAAQQLREEARTRGVIPRCGP